MHKNIAVILAGGIGSRTGLKKPKQFLKIAGKTILEHTLDVFEKHPKINEIAIVAKHDFHYYIDQLLKKSLYKKVKKILCSGNERYQSTLSALNAYKDEIDSILIIHDAVRPMISHSIIDACIEAMNKYDAVDVAIPASDTIIEVENDFIYKIPIRSRMYSGQTPQCFKVKVLKKAYDIALKDKNFQVTDDCKVVVNYLPDTKVFVVNGATSNIKLTHIEDLYLIEKLFQIKKLNIENTDFNFLKNKNIIVFGGNSGIGKSIVYLASKYNANIESYSRSNQCDIRNIADVKNALSLFYKKYKRIDSVIVCSSVLIKESLYSSDYNNIFEQIDVNYTGSVICAKESFNYLKESKGNLILFTSSSYSLGRMNYSIYSSAKSAIVNFTQALAEEWFDFNIKVNCICPHRTNTPMRTKNFGTEDLSTLLSPYEVAEKTLQLTNYEYSGNVIEVKINEY